MRRREALDRLAEFTRHQSGLVTRAQARAAGLDDRLILEQVRGGDLERVVHGVYRFRRDLQPTHQDLWAAWLQLEPTTPAWRRIQRAEGPGAVVSGASAAALYGIGDLWAPMHEFTVERPRRTRRRDVRLRVARLAAAEWELVEGLPATRPDRIAVDLLIRHSDAGHVGELVADALWERLATREGLAGALGTVPAENLPRAGMDGQAVMDYLLENAGRAA